MKKILFCLAAFAALVSCTKENPVDETPAVEYQTITFEATAPSAEDVDATKTALVDGSLVHWVKGDQVKVMFVPINGWDYKDKWPGEEYDGASGVMTATFDTESSASALFHTDSWDWGVGSEYMGVGIAVYPSSVETYSHRNAGSYKANAPTVISYNLPSNQTAVENSFQNGVVFSYAEIADVEEFAANQSKLNFKNACALIKITLPSDATDIVSLTVESSDATLSGKHKVSGYSGTTGSYPQNYPTYPLKMTSDGGMNNVTLAAPTGETLKAGASYYIVTWPGSHSNGLSFTFTNTSGLTNTKQLAQSVELEASKIDHFNFKNSISFEQKFEISQTELTLGAANGSSASFTVLAGNSWNVTSDQSWITISPASGAGSPSEQTVTISAAENDAADSRTATVTVTDDKGTAKTITVTQNAPSMSVKVMYEPLSYNDLYNFATVDSNVAWNLSSDQTWLSFKQTSGEAGKFNIQLIFSENPESTDRTAIITLTNTSGTIVKTTTFTQPAKPKTYYIVNQITEASALEDGAFYVIEFSGYTNYYWKIDNYGNVVRSYVNKSNGFAEDYVYRFEKTNYSNPIGGYNSYSTGHLWSAKSDKYFNWYNLNFADGHKADLVFENRHGSETGSEIDIYEHYDPYRTIYYTGSKLAWGETGQSNRKWNIYKVEVR